METGEKITQNISAYWFVIMTLFTIIGIYGRQAIVWVLMKFYEFFVQLHP